MLLKVVLWLSLLSDISIGVAPDNKNVFTYVSDDLTTVEGRNISLLCQATTSEVKWVKAKGSFPVDRVNYPLPGELTIRSVIQSDTGTYICQAGLQSQLVAVTVNTPPRFTAYPLSTKVILGQPFCLTCSAVGLPFPSLSWFTPDKVSVDTTAKSFDGNEYVFENGSLCVTSAHMNHHGMYRCIATNDVLSVESKAYVIVQYKPSITEISAPVSVVEGSSLILQCVAIGRPFPVISWFFGIQQIYSTRKISILSNGTLLITDVLPRHGGVYTCETRNPTGRAYANVSVKVLVKPVFMQTPVSKHVRLGQLVKLTCVASGPSPIRYIWKKDGSYLSFSDNVRYINNTVVIESVEIKDLGEYECFVLSETGTISSKASIYFKGVPVLTITPSNNITTNSSNRLIIKCRSVSTEPVINWFTCEPRRILGVGIKKLGQGANAVITSDGDLLFERISYKDRGCYLCQARNTYGSSQEQVYLHVQKPPVIDSLQSPVTAFESSSVTLRCRFSADPPVTKVTWHHPRSNTYITSIKQNGNLVLQDLSVIEHSGKWSCLACNILGCAHGFINVLINGAPVFTKTILRPMADYIQIYCTGIGYPTPRVNYYINDENVMVGNHRYSFTPKGMLTVFNASYSNIYTCKLINMYGSVKKLLTVPSVPSEPHSLTVVNTTSTSITLQWKLPIKGAETVISYNVGYRPKGSNIWAATTAWSLVARVLSLVPYTDYRFRVRCFNGMGYSDFSTEIGIETAPAAPSPPQNIQLRRIDDGLNISWDEPALFNGPKDDIIYELSYRQLDSLDDLKTVSMDAKRQANMTGLNLNLSYVFHIRAGNLKLNAWSSAIIKTINFAKPVPFERVTIIDIYAASVTSIVVSWLPLVSRYFTVDGYIVAHALIARNFTFTSMSSVKHILTALTPNNDYTVMVAAYNKFGIGEYTKPKTVSTTVTESMIRRSGLSSEGLVAILSVVGILVLFVTMALFMLYCRRKSRKMNMLRKKKDIKRHLPVNDSSGPYGVELGRMYSRGFYNLKQPINDKFDDTDLKKFSTPNPLKSVWSINDQDVIDYHNSLQRSRNLLQTDYELGEIIHPNSPAININAGRLAVTRAGFGNVLNDLNSNPILSGSVNLRNGIETKSMSDNISYESRNLPIRKGDMTSFDADSETDSEYCRVSRHQDKPDTVSNDRISISVSNTCISSQLPVNNSHEAFMF